MNFEGDIGVIDVLRTKHKELKEGQVNDDIRILCIVDGGLMKGAYATGAGLALEELGYSNVFSDFVGVSSGAPSAAYFLAGEVFKGSSLIYEECTTRKFFNPWNLFSPLNPDVIIDAMKVGPKKLSWDNIKRNRTKLHIGVASYKDAEPRLLEITNEEQLYQAIGASIAIPTFANSTFLIEGSRYTDGGFASPHILEECLERISATHVLIFTNQDKETKDIPKLEKLLNNTIFRYKYSEALRNAANNRRIARHSLIEKILKGKYDIPICIVWGDYSISSMERSSEAVKNTVERSRSWWHELLAK